MLLAPKFLLSAIATLALIGLAGCGYPIYEEKIDGPYRALAIDTPSQMMVCYRLSEEACIGRVDHTVFAVGWNENYIVAARHPPKDRSDFSEPDFSKTEYFYIIRALDRSSANVKDVTRGPFDRAGFDRERVLHGLPEPSRNAKA